MNIEKLNFPDFLQSLETNPLPLEFGNALTTSEFLQQLFTYVKNITENTEDKTEKMREEFSRKFSEIVTELEQRFNEDLLIDKYMNTLDNHFKSLICDNLKYITFELDENGYFCAYIPDNWNDEISFDTIVDTKSSDYGKLVIEF